MMRGQRAMSGYLGVQNVSDLLFDSIQGDFVLERLQLLICELVFPILAQIANRGTYPDHEICGILTDPLEKVLNHVPLLPEGVRATIVLTEHLKKRGEVLRAPRSDASCPVEHIRGVTLQGRHYQRHEVGILIVITVVSDTAGPLPKGISHIIRMSLLTTEFRNLDFTRKSILLLSSPSEGAHIIGVAAISALSTPSTSTPLTRRPVAMRGITRCSLVP